MKRRDFLKAAGLLAGAVTVNGLAGLAPDGAPAAMLSADLEIGDIFTIAGYYAVNPITRQCTEHLQQFVVTHVNDSGVNLYPHHP